MESLLAFARIISSASECEQMRADFPHKRSVFRFLALIRNLCSHLLAAALLPIFAFYYSPPHAARSRVGAAAALPPFVKIASASW